MSATHKIAGNVCFAFVSMASVLFDAETVATKMLKAGNAEFRREVIKVTEDVYTVIGYFVQPPSTIVGTCAVISHEGT